MKNLEGKVALVTGAAAKRGMGHAIARRLGQEGARVAVADKLAAPKSMWPGDEDWGGLDDVVKEIKEAGSDAMSLLMDISQSKEVDAAIAAIVKKFGRLDILVHCAAIRGPVGTPVVDLPEETWQAVMDVNATGSFLVAKAAAKQMIAQGEGGRMVIIASMAGTHGVPGSAAYSASKFATLGLAGSLALELARYQITVNAINPGMVATNLRDESFEKMSEKEGITWEQARQRDHEMLHNRIPLGRLGKPEEIADLAYFLVSDQSVYITGESVNFTGGVV